MNGRDVCHARQCSIALPEHIESRNAASRHKCCDGWSLMPVQIFGTKKSSATRKAERFFAERRIPVHVVDLAERGASKGELQRFAQKFGADALVDRTSRRFLELGLGPARYGPDRWLEILIDEPLMLVQPLVRNGSKLTVGGDGEAEWKAWVADGLK